MTSFTRGCSVARSRELPLHAGLTCHDIEGPAQVSFVRAPHRAAARVGEPGDCVAARGPAETTFPRFISLLVFKVCGK